MRKGNHGLEKRVEVEAKKEVVKKVLEDGVDGIKEKVYAALVEEVKKKVEEDLKRQILD